MGFLRWLADVRAAARYETQVRLIAEQLAGHLRPPGNYAAMMDPSTAERKAKAKDALWAMITSVPGLAIISTEYNLDRAGLDDLLNCWVIGDLWVGNQFVSVSALTHPKTLRYALSKRGTVNGFEWASTLAGMVKARDYWE